MANEKVKLDEGKNLRRQRDDIAASAKNPKFKMIEGICAKFGSSFRRHFAEIENIQVRKEGSHYETTEFAAELLKFIVHELSHTAKGVPVLTQGQGEIPTEADAQCWLVHVGGNIVNLEHGRSDVHITFTHVAKGRATCAIVYFPLEERVYTAEYGKGAMAPHMRMRCSGREELKNTMISVFSPVSNAKPEDTDAYLKVIKNMRTLNMHFRTSGSPVWDAIQCALGKLDGVVFMNISTHDILTARLFLEESGAKATDIEGGAITANTTTLVAAGAKYQPKLLGLV